MSGLPRLQVQAGGAFFWPANVLRVMGPAQGAQLRILAPARLGHEAFALGSAGTDKQAAQAPRGRTGPAGSRAGSRRSPRARLWSPGSWEQPAARPNPRRGGAARWGGSARMAPRPRTRGTHGIPLRASGRGGHRSAPRRRGLMKGRSKRVGGKKGSRFLGNVATERSCLLTGSIH